VAAFSSTAPALLIVEIARVASVPDRKVAEAIGTEKGGFVVVTHSGSRNLGHASAKRVPDRELFEAAIDPSPSSASPAVSAASGSQCSEPGVQHPNLPTVTEQTGTSEGVPDPLSVRLVSIRVAARPE